MRSDRRARAWLPYATTTLSSAASGSAVPVTGRSRVGWLVGAASVIAGSAIGAVLALYVAPAREPPGRGAAAAHAGRAAAGSAHDAPVDRHPVLVAQIKDALVRFVAWAGEHPAGPGVRCPDAVAIGAAVLDPWGQPLRVVCTDQPADQIAGVHSCGPDGSPGTADDIVSWALGAEVTDLVRGPRWIDAAGGHRVAPPAHPSRAPARATTSRRAPAEPARAPAAPPPASAGAGSDDVDDDGIPDRR